MGASVDEIVRFLAPFYPPPQDALLRGEQERRLLLEMLGFDIEDPRHVASTQAFYIDSCSQRGYTTCRALISTP